MSLRAPEDQELAGPHHLPRGLVKGKGLWQHGVLTPVKPGEECMWSAASDPLRKQLSSGHMGAGQGMPGLAGSSNNASGTGERAGGTQGFSGPWEEGLGLLPGLGSRDPAVHI